ncbi:MAG: hypothetical protein JNL05_00455 [Flavobacteriales bacterium]|nr:hypothetical protein [Flavobacteriales bacterium]
MPAGYQSWSANPKLFHTRTKSWLRFAVEDVVTPAPLAQWTLTFGSGTTLSSQIALNFVADSITFVATNTLAYDGGEFLVGATAGQAAQKFAEGARLNPWLGRHFMITASGSTVTFQALQAGTDYNLDSLSVVNVTVTHAVVTSGGTAVVRPNYGVLVTPWIEDANVPGGYRRLPDMSGEPYASQPVNFFLHNVLRPYLTPDVLGYAVFEDAVPHTTSCRKFYVQARDRYGSTPTETGMRYFGTPDTPNLCWLAGTARSEAQRFQAFVTNVVDGPTRYWLTWRNRGYARKVTTAERHWLCWYAHWWSDSSTLQMQARITYCDPGGANVTTGSWTTRYTVSDWTLGRPHSFKVDHGTLDLAALLPSGKVLLRYDVRLFASVPGVLSEEMSFHLEEEDYNEVHLMYWSSLGAWESLRTTGAWREPVEAANVEVYTPFQPTSDVAVEDAELSTTPGTAQRSLVVATGFHPLAEHEALLDILNSPAVYLVDRTLGRWLPLRLLEGNAVRGQRGTTEEHLHDLQLEFLADDPQTCVTRVP